MCWWRYSITSTYLILRKSDKVTLHRSVANTSNLSTQQRARFKRVKQYMDIKHHWNATLLLQQTLIGCLYIFIYGMIYSNSNLKKSQNNFNIWTIHGSNIHLIITKFTIEMQVKGNINMFFCNEYHAQYLYFVYGRKTLLEHNSTF